MAAAAAYRRNMYGGRRGFYGAVPGCSCPACTGNPAPTPGLSGFSETGEEDFAAGTITGYRWWLLTAPDLNKHPLDADEHWPRSRLSGARAAWESVVNEAVCLAGPGAHEDAVPGRSCGCGFWSYWKLGNNPLGTGAGFLPMSGVIEGWGRTRIGELGFRCSKARILALCPKFAIGAGRRESGWYNAFSPPAIQQLTAAERDWCEAWMAVIETRLEETYTGVKLFTSQMAMLAEYPLDPAYAKPEADA